MTWGCVTVTDPNNGKWACVLGQDKQGMRMWAQLAVSQGRDEDYAYVWVVRARYLTKDGIRERSTSCAVLDDVMNEASAVFISECWSASVLNFPADELEWSDDAETLRAVDWVLLSDEEKVRSAAGPDVNR
jgi:hypothetical protein